MAEINNEIGLTAMLQGESSPGAARHSPDLYEKEKLGEHNETKL
jgi:hypothetical protein